MLPSSAPKESVQKLLELAAPKNNWPDDEVSVVHCEWKDHDEADTSENVKEGYWLIRFRVTTQVANHIKDKQEGKIYINTMNFTVYHDRKPWLDVPGKPKRVARLCHESEPAAAAEAPKGPPQES